MSDVPEKKPTLILLHAAGRGGRSWHAVAPLLADAFTVLTPDLPGFNDAPGPFTVAAAVRHIAELANTQPSPVRLCGLSLGASVALAVAAEHPDLADRVVASAPAIHGARHPRTVALYRRAPGWAVRRLTDMPGRAAWLSFVDEIAAIDLTDDLPKITAKTLVLCGSRDRANLPEAKLASDAIPNGAFYLVPHVGHAWPVTQPKLFATVVRPFLTAPRGDTAPQGETAPLGVQLGDVATSDRPGEPRPRTSA
jgi:3-oxoadipate enol-lactonase